MMQLRMTRRAESELDRIQAYYEDTTNSSLQVVERFDAAFNHLCRWPRSGRQRPELLGSGYLFWPVSPYTIVYKVDIGSIIIVAVLHGSRDLESALSSTG